MSATAPSPESAATDQLTVVLIGNPNTGKSTLFNALSGMQARIGNFPGVTVEKKTGRYRDKQGEITLVDLPGTYSLSPRSADEMVSVDVMLGRVPDVGRPDAVVCIVDASNLERNLYLFSQVRDLDIPVVLVLNMWDLATRRGVTIDVDALRERLGVPIVTTSAHRRHGMDELRSAIREAAARERIAPDRVFPQTFYEEVERLQGWLTERDREGVPTYLLERMLFDIGGESEHRFAQSTSDELPAYLQEARARLAENGCRVPAAETKHRYAWIREQLDGIVTRTETDTLTASDRIDRVITHRVWGLLFFAGLMFLVFQAIYNWAGPFMELIEGGQEIVAGTIQGAMPPGMLRSLLIDGVVAGVGGVIVFLPQICFLFLFIAILEDCGYMARAAFLMDKLMTRLGLSGKSFVPLMSSFACAIPGVMATRVIENRRDRMVTILVAPLMSCSARLPVYLLLIATFVPATALGGWGQGLALFAMHLVGALVAIPVAWILRKTFFKGETPPFVMELPAYKWPSPRVVLHRVYDRGMAFVTRAGTLIFCTTVLVWAAGYFPGDHTELQAVTAEIEQLEEAAPLDEAGEERLAELAQAQQRLSGQLIETSYLGRIGHAIEPVVRPLGWDWRIGVGAIASFPAREVIIATLGTIYSLGGDVDEEDPGLRQSIRNATWPDGRPVYNVPVAFSIMVFFALCAQCAATLMVIRRETNSWGWPIFTFTYMTLLAYVAALATYQIGMLLMA
ncbi:Ferrous iron transport protein B [Maioricimonas rarisocia]|uniref:Ferrous iron transport protein B n=1 Tax=Maioricimonas rarisocia TaxID=2528026 RepID=A0A517ZCC8_9PLAN|nr:ferrous iron transport protein B [Maioricimonas rarisocia]QDU40090.1 Ferrous iron transport protein B [Maioricimonas rarisocia]